MSTYWQLNLAPLSAAPEALEAQLAELGACAISFEDAGDEAILEPELGTTPLWSQTKISALFTEESTLHVALALLKYSYPNLSHTIEMLPEQDWERAWIQHFQPMQFGNNTWICPSWCDPPVATAVNILLDPGLAFGTGTHATTALCLQWIDQANLTDKTVIDYGCGSGILAIAALLHGAQHVYAIDHDPQALQATKENAERNTIALQRLSILAPEELPKTLQSDVIIANILATPLIDLAPFFAKQLKAHGKIILSGILHDQTDTIFAAYQTYFTDFEVTEQEGWVRVVASLRK